MLERPVAGGLHRAVGRGLRHPRGERPGRPGRGQPARQRVVEGDAARRRRPANGPASNGWPNVPDVSTGKLPRWSATRKPPSGWHVASQPMRRSETIERSGVSATTTGRPAARQPGVDLARHGRGAPAERAGVAGRLHRAGVRVDHLHGHPERALRAVALDPARERLGQLAVDRAAVALHGAALDAEAAALGQAVGDEQVAPAAPRAAGRLDRRLPALGRAASRRSTGRRRAAAGG